MKPTKIKRLVPIFAIALVGGWVVFSGFAQRRARLEFTAWEPTVSPGALSSSHAFLANNCTACHTPTRGVEAASCIACHANDQSLLQRQPTAFHADVRSCVECHVEHGGADRRPTQMDHAALARLGLRQNQSSGDSAVKGAKLAERISRHAGQSALPPRHPTVTPVETALSCVTCHANQDRHQQMFGTDCIQCHATTAWTIPEFRHPPPSSTSCVQCHQAPPSHYMMHFEMVSMKVAGQEHAQVSECFKCHQTTSWNDIKGVGWYKHH